jgi:CheY-like chemotaxis protein
MPRRAPARILIVDDDEGLRLLMADALRADGYDVATAQSGSEALAWLETHKPDLMLLDLKMNDVGGQALVKRLKQHHTPVPFLVVTGQGDEKVAVDVMKQGALDYVMKDTGLLDLLPGVVKRAVETIDRDRQLMETEASLRESEARFAAAMRATNDGVWEWRLSDDGAYYSPRWKAILGYQPDEIPDHRDEWRRRIHPQDVLRVDAGRLDARGDLLHERVGKPAEVGLDQRVLLLALAQDDGACEQTRVDSDARFKGLRIQTRVGIGEHLLRAFLGLLGVRTEDVGARRVGEHRRAHAAGYVGRCRTRLDAGDLLGICCGNEGQTAQKERDGQRVESAHDH